MVNLIGASAAPRTPALEAFSFSKERHELASHSECWATRMREVGDELVRLPGGTPHAYWGGGQRVPRRGARLGCGWACTQARSPEVEQQADVANDPLAAGVSGRRARYRRRGVVYGDRAALDRDGARPSACRRPEDPGRDALPGARGGPVRRDAGPSAGRVSDEGGRVRCCGRAPARGCPWRPRLGGGTRSRRRAASGLVRLGAACVQRQDARSSRVRRAPRADRAVG